MSHFMKFRNILSVAIATVVLTWGAQAQAAEFKAGDFISFLRGATSTGDVYAAGQSVSVERNVQGDVMVAGMNIRVNGEVTGNVMAAGSNVDVLGRVGHAVRAAGSRVSVDAIVEGDALLGGAMIYVPQGAVISGDLYVGAGTAVIDGTVKGNVKVGGGQISINGDIGGNVDATADDLTLGENAKVGGKLKYSSPKPARIASTSTVAGGLDYTEVKKPVVENQAKSMTSGQKAAAILMGFLIGFVLWLVASLVALWLFRDRVTTVSNAMLNDFGRNLGWGFIWLVVVPVACIVLLMTVIGAVVGIILGVVYAVTILAAKVVTGMALGLWLMRKLNKDDKRIMDWKAVVLGVLVLQAVMLIPIVGWIGSFILFLVALGAVVSLAKPLVK